jgi:hypothetical protein
MNFRKLWENMKYAKDQGSESPEIDPMAVTAIRTGLGISESFWDDFIQILNNSEGLSALLDVSVDEISTWRKKIEDALSQVGEEDGDLDVGKNKKLVKTGQPEEPEDDEDFSGA